MMRITPPRQARGLAGHRRLVRLLVAIAAVIGAIVAGTTVAASANSGGSEGRHVIHMQTTLVSVTTNSAGNGGPGDVNANLWSFTTSSGVTGHADISCQVFPGSEQLCHASFVFPDGQIYAMTAATPMLNQEFRAGIIGGTGAYVGASGQIVNTPVAPGVINRAFYLLSVKHDD